MASVTLGVVGAAIPGAGIIAAPLLAAAGSYIDQRFLFKQESAEAKQAVGSIQLSGVNEGGPVPWPLSWRVRVPCQVIALSDLIVEQTEESQGGKQGNVKITTQRYYVNVACAVAGRRLNAIPRVWANGKIILKEGSGPLEYTSSNIRTRRSIWYKEGDCESDPPDPENPCIIYYRLHLIEEVTANVWDDFWPGLDVTVSGFTGLDAANNGTWRVESKQGDFEIVLVGSPDFTVADSGDTVTVSQDRPDFGYGVADDVRVKLGSESQQRDSVITDIAGELGPSYNGTALVIFERLSLDYFNGVMPQFSAQVETYDAIQSNAEIIDDILSNRYNMSSSRYDVSALGTENSLGFSRGYILAGPQSAAESIRPLMVAHGIGAAEYDGVVHFYDKGSEPTVTIDSDHLAAHEWGEQPQDRKVRRRRPASRLLPKAVIVKYLDTANGMQPASQRENAHGVGTGHHIIEIDLPLVMGASNARKIARRELWNMRTQNEEWQFTLPPSQMALVPGDRLLITDEGEEVSVILSSVVEGANFLLECTGYVEQSQTADPEEGTSDDPVNDPDDDEVALPPATVIVALNAPSLVDSDAATPAYYFAAALADKTVGFSSMVAFASANNITYTQILTLAAETTMGYAFESSLDSGPVGYLDQESSLSVSLNHGTLSSATEEAVLGGANLAMVGDEVVAFLSAVLEADGTYTVTLFLRGLFGTEDLIGAHVEDEPFVLINSFGPTVVPINISEIGSRKYWKAVPSGGTIDDYPAWTTTLNGRNLEPYSPTAIRGARNGSNDDILISWTRRSRYSADFLSFTDPPLGEAFEQYEIDIYDSGFSSVVRTVVVDDATSYNYDDSTQSGDGLTPGDPLNVIIYQMSDTVGRGTGRSATV